MSKTKVVIKKKTAPVAKTEIIKFDGDDKKVIALMSGFAKKGDVVLELAKEATSLFQRVYRALAVIDPKKWTPMMDAANIPPDSSYRQSIPRAARHPKEADKALKLTGNINKTIGLLPTAEKTASGSTVKGGRPKMSAEAKIKAKAKTCLEFLIAHFEVEEIVNMLRTLSKAEASKVAAASKKQEEEEEEEEEED